jgi:Flp pilus assembly protein TadG
MKFRNLTVRPAFFADRRGNAAIIFAFAATPLFVATGAAIDYAFAAKVKTQLGAIADAAVLSAMTPPMMTQSEATAKAAAADMFAAQARLVKGFVFDQAKLTIDVEDTASIANSNSKSRTVRVVYSGQVVNAFGGLLYKKYTNFTVEASADLSTAPNIDFYLLLDNSPSMELPATTAGINSMVSGTGCAFACHESNFKDSELKKYAGWGKYDSYTYAKKNNITLRIDNVRAAAQSLASTAQSTMAANGAAYRLAAYGFNYQLTQLQSLVPTTSANVGVISANIGTMTPPLMASNGNLEKNQPYTYPIGLSTYKTVNSLSASLYNNDAMTDFGMAMKQISAIIPDPGGGTNAIGDTPQKVLMIVTDGVDDANFYSSGQCNTSYSWSYSNSYGSFYRCQQPIDPSACTAIKNRGIRIAVLYTTYFPVTSNSWYNSTVAPFISQVPLNLQSCASSPQLYFEVNTNGDITQAMTDLFKNAVSTAPHLTR